MGIRSALTLAAATAGIISASTGVASAHPLADGNAHFIMVTSTAFCGITPDGQGWERVNVGDWGSMAFMPSKYSLDPTTLKKGQYYRFTIDDQNRLFDIEEDPNPAFGLGGCDRIGA